MFAIYADQGLLLRSSLEELYRVEGVSPTKRVRAVAEQTKERISGYPHLSGEAVIAYRNMINSRKDEAIYHASQIMNRPVVTVHEGLTVTECFELLRTKNIRQAPVLNDVQKPVGLITRENLLTILIVEDGRISHAERQDITPLVTRPLIAADPVSDIRRVAQVMYECDLGCIPVTNDADTIIGIITRTDIVRAVSLYPAIALWA